jgi:hypothetical protein
MTKINDRKFDWVAALALIMGAAVLIPSLSALAVNVIAVVKRIW